MEIPEPTVFEQRQPGRKRHIKPWVIRDLCAWLQVKLSEVDNAIARLSNDIGGPRYSEHANTLRYYRWSASCYLYLIDQLRHPTDELILWQALAATANASHALIEGNKLNCAEGMGDIIRGTYRAIHERNLSQNLECDRSLVVHNEGGEQAEPDSDSGGLAAPPAKKPNARRKGSNPKHRVGTDQSQESRADDTGDRPSTHRAKHSNRNKP